MTDEQINRRADAIQINRRADAILQQFYPFKDRENLKRQAAIDMAGYVTLPYEPGPEPDRLTQVNQQIEELEAKIAADRASRERGHELYSGRYKNNPMYKLALFDYVINGDRTGLDNFDKNERAITEAEANRQNAIALAQMNKASMAQSDMGKLIEKKDMLQADIDAIDELLKKSPNDNKLLRERAKTIAQMNYVNQMLGVKEIKTEDPSKTIEGSTEREKERKKQLRQQNITNARAELDKIDKRDTYQVNKVMKKYGVTKAELFGK